MTDLLDIAMSDLVPSFVDERPDWADVVARTGSAGTQRVPVWRRPRLLITALLLVVLVALMATPAFGVQGFVLNLLGRKNVSFANSPSAPNEVKKQFEDLSIGAPAIWTPQVIAGQARVVAGFSIAGRPRKLWNCPGGGVGPVVAGDRVQHPADEDDELGQHRHEEPPPARVHPHPQDQLQRRGDEQAAGEQGQVGEVAHGGGGARAPWPARAG